MKKTIFFSAIFLVVAIFISACQQANTQLPDSQTPQNVQQQKECIPNWQCSEWSKCSFEGKQNRTCVDQNDCGITTFNKPLEEQTCEPDYFFYDINQTQVKLRYSEGPVEVTLLKVGKKIVGDKLRLIIYWKIQNIGTKNVIVFPDQKTIILDGFGGQYISKLEEQDTDCVDLETSTLRPTVILECGVVVNNVPQTAKNIKVILGNVGFIGDYEFDVALDSSNQNQQQLAEQQPVLTGKYTLADVEEVKTLAKQCRFDFTSCEKDYYSKISTTMEYVIPNSQFYPPEKEGYVDLTIMTPFLHAAKTFSEKEKSYETYTNEDIIKILNEDYINIFLKWTQGDSYYIKGIGIGVDNLVLKYSGAIFQSKPSTFFSGGNVIVKSISNYTQFRDKTVNLVIVGDKGEKEVSVDMSKYK